MRPIFRTWLRLRDAEARATRAANREEQLQRFERAVELQALTELVRIEHETVHPSMRRLRGELEALLIKRGVVSGKPVELEPEWLRTARAAGEELTGEIR